MKDDAWHEAKARREGKAPDARDAALDDRKEVENDQQLKEWRRDHEAPDSLGEERVAQPHASAREEEAS